jgi:type I restriction enzyme S subunit
MSLNLAREKTPMVMKASLSLVAKSHTLRCDARQAERRFAEFSAFISSVEHFHLRDFLPKPLTKGVQPRYIESLEPEGVPVISTIAIQLLTIRTELCRYITQEEYDAIGEERKPRKGDVLLTMDGGTSIGKPVLFDLEGDFAIDSHVAILRPVGLDPRYLVYLLASPFGQVQFQQAESGASGQTAVTEEDLRRFRFPVLPSTQIDSLVQQIEEELRQVGQQARALSEKQQHVWEYFGTSLIKAARPPAAREKPGSVSTP